MRARGAVDLLIAIGLAAGLWIVAAAGWIAAGLSWSAVKPAALGVALGLCGSAVALTIWNRRQRRPQDSRPTPAERVAPSPVLHVDPLTRLLDRSAFLDQLGRVIEARRRGGAHFALLMIDLDRFRNINDIHGHAVGDTVLIETARRMSSLYGAGTTIARLGGDEFAILVEADEVGELPRRMAQKLLENLSAPISIPQGLLRVSATIGIVGSQFQNASSEELLRAANIALAEGKREKRGSIRYFEAGMDEALRLRSTLEADLRRALSAGEIVPFYQPLIALDDGRLTGFEVLARWQHPQYGLISTLR